MRSPNDLVYGETNRYPLFVNSAVGCIRYWLKLARMEASRLPSNAYRMLQVLDERGERIWASKVRCINMGLILYGWIKVWKKWTNFTCFSWKINCLSMAKMAFPVETSDRFNVYRKFFTIHDTKTYLNVNIDRHLKFIMTRFRLGISDIFVHVPIQRTYW